MTPDAPERTPGDPDPAPAAPRLVVENTRARGGAHAPAHLVTLAETARDYAEASSSANTRKALILFRRTIAALRHAKEAGEDGVAVVEREIGMKQLDGVLPVIGAVADVAGQG